MNTKLILCLIIAISGSKAFSFGRIGEEIDNILHIEEESELEKIGKEIGKGLNKVAEELEEDVKIVVNEIEKDAKIIADEIKKDAKIIADEIEKDVKIVGKAIEDEIVYLEEQGETAFEDAFGDDIDIGHMISHFFAQIISGAVIAYQKISADFESIGQTFGIQN